jgi:hypothetical protein
MAMDWMSWKTWTIIGLIIVGLFAIYAFAAQSARNHEEVTITRPTSSTSGRPFTTVAPGVGTVHMEWLESQSGSYRSERNLFAYREPPPPPPKYIPPPAPVPVPVPVPQPEPQPTAPVPPQFPYHYIGTFGTSTNPIATFSGNGEIINVRVGETIDGKFILRGIGIESAEIGYVGFAPDVKTRIPIGQ